MIILLKNTQDEEASFLQLHIIFISLCNDTFQFWQILSESSFMPRSALIPAGIRTSSAHSTQARARQGSFPEHTHAPLRLSGALEKSRLWRLSGEELTRTSWLLGNLAASSMSQRNESALGIICKIALSNIRERVGKRGNWREGTMLLADNTYIILNNAKYTCLGPDPIFFLPSR